MKKCICGKDGRIDKIGKQYHSCEECFKIEQRKRIEKMKQVNLVKYGVENAMHCEEVKNRLIESNIKKYGVKNPMQTDFGKKQLEDACIKKYGVKNVSNLESTRKKISEVKRSKSVEENTIINNKRAETNLKKYGVKHLSSKKDFMKNIFLKKYGVENPMYIQKNVNKCFDNRKQNKLETSFFENVIKKIDIKAERNKLHCGFIIDFYLPSYDIFLEMDGDYWHGKLPFKEDSETGKKILKTMKRDKIQNNIIHNLVRVTELEARIEVSLVKA